MRVAIIITILLLIEYFSFSAYRTVFNPRLTSTVIYILLHAGLIAYVFIGFLLSQNRTIDPTLRLIFGLIAVYYISRLLIVIPLLLEDVVRVVTYLFAIFQAKSQPTFYPERRKMVSIGALALASLPFTSLVWGILANAYRYKVHRIKIAIEGLHPDLEGLTIGQISDFHSGSLGNHYAVEKGIKTLNSLNCDLVCFTGDLVNERTDEVYPFEQILSQIKAPMGVYAILGNHDYGDYSHWPDADAKTQNLKDIINFERKLGWDLLLNQHRTINIKNAKIAIVGVENWGHSLRFPKYGDLNMATQGLSTADFTLLLSHDPSHFDAQIKQHAHKFDLTLSGHTHGMQFGVELPFFKWSPVKYIYPKWAGAYSEGNRHLYVNRGFGFIGYPGRVGILPEITHITLTKA